MEKKQLDFTLKCISKIMLKDCLQKQGERHNVKKKRRDKRLKMMLYLQDFFPSR